MSFFVTTLIILAGIIVGVIAVHQRRKGELSGRSTALVFGYIAVMAVVIVVNNIPSAYPQLVNVS